MNEQTVVIWVSWGADSMYLLSCIQERRKDKKRQPLSLHILSCNHNTRENINNEIQTVQDYCRGHTFFTALYKGKWFWEEDLRTRRHNTFVDYCIANNSKILLLWHHFNDRIETTLLNIKRGCNIQWLLWLETIKPHFLNHTISIVRPLLCLSKTTILTECQSLSIPYHNDPSNSDITHSQRNKMRYIVDKYFHTKGFYNSMGNLYTIIEQKKKLENYSENNNHLQWAYSFIYNSDWSIVSNITQGNRSPDSIYNIYKHFWIILNPRSTTLENLSKNLNQKSWSTISYKNITIKSFRYASLITINK